MPEQEIVECIADNIHQINNSLRRIARERGFAEGKTSLIAVSKNQPTHAILAALDAGHRLFGENKVQEATAHWCDLKPLYPDIELHLIGPLQTNKVSAAVQLFDVIQTLDREKLALVLSAELEKVGRQLSCYIQVNTGEEPQKAGIRPYELTAFIEFCRHQCGLAIQGLMCIPPVGEPAGLHFALLKDLARKHGLEKLSMGMSADYKKAAALGADYVRIGTAVFGERIKDQPL